MKTLLNWVILSGIFSLLTYFMRSDGVDNTILNGTFWCSIVVFALTLSMFAFFGFIRSVVRFIRSVLGI